MVSRDPVPIGRRVAYLRVRRRLSQQSFADRLGKSKSWVDKIERAVRSLERVSTIREIAAVLRVDAAVLLGRDVRPAGVTEHREGVARIRAALSTYPMAFGRATDREVMSLRGSLLVQAALIAARAGDDRLVSDLLDEAAALAVQVGDGHDHHRTAFGPTAVELARVAAAVELGDGPQAVARHEKAIGRDGWRWLPIEHRAAHLIDAARAYLQADNLANAARVLLRAERIAPAEIRHRPAARDLVAKIARDPDVPPTITQLAIGLGVL